MCKYLILNLFSNLNLMKELCERKNSWKRLHLRAWFIKLNSALISPRILITLKLKWQIMKNQIIYSYWTKTEKENFTKIEKFDLTSHLLACATDILIWLWQTNCNKDFFFIFWHFSTNWTNQPKLAALDFAIRFGIQELRSSISSWEDIMQANSSVGFQV